MRDSLIILSTPLAKKEFERHIVVDANSDCHLWNGDTLFTVNNVRINPVIFAYWAYANSTPSTKPLTRTCGNNNCVNPDHMKQDGKVRSSRRKRTTKKVPHVVESCRRIAFSKLNLRCSVKRYNLPENKLPD